MGFGVSQVWVQATKPSSTNWMTLALLTDPHSSDTSAHSRLLGEQCNNNWRRGGRGGSPRAGPLRESIETA